MADGYTASLSLPANDAYPEAQDLEITAPDEASFDALSSAIMAKHKRDGLEAKTTKAAGGKWFPPTKSVLGGEPFVGPKDPDEEARVAQRMADMGAGDVLTTAVKGGVRNFAAGLYGAEGALEDVFKGIYGDKRWFSGNWNTSHMLGHYNSIADSAPQPTTSVGQDVLGAVGDVAQQASDLEEKGLDATIGVEHPIAKTIAHTLLTVIASDAMGAFGSGTVTGSGVRAVTNRIRIAGIKRELEDKYGIVLGSGQIKEQIANAASDLTAGDYHGAGVENLAPDVQSRAQSAGTASDFAFARARGDTINPDGTVTKAGNPGPGMPASVRGGALADVGIQAEKDLASSDIPIDVSPKVKYQIESLKSMNDTQAMGVTPYAKLSYIESKREALNKVINSSSDPQEAMALTHIKGLIDDKITSELDKNLILGNKDQIDAYRQSYQIRGNERKLFEGDAVIDRLVSDPNMTPEEVKKAVLSASSVAGPKKGGLAAIKRLEDIFGADSPQVNGIKKEIILDTIEPLLSKVNGPNLQAFAGNYEKLMRNNRTLANYFGVSDNLQRLYEVSVAALKSGAESPINLNMNRILSQIMFGNELSKSAMKRSMAEKVIANLRGKGAGQTRAILHELLGYDPYKNIAPVGSAAWANAQSTKLYGKGDVPPVDIPNDTGEQQ